MAWAGALRPFSGLASRHLRFALGPSLGWPHATCGPPRAASQGPCRASFASTGVDLRREHRPRDPSGLWVRGWLWVGVSAGLRASYRPPPLTTPPGQILRGIGCTSVRFRAERTSCSAFASAGRYRHPSGRFVYRRTTSASLRASRTASRTDLEGKGMTVAVSRPPPTSLSTITTRRRKCR